MSVLVTGGAGYIGSHVAWMLHDHDRDVVVVDDLSTGVADNVPEGAPLVRGDVGDRELIRDVVDEYDVSSIMHFAGSIVVPESVEKPLEYYDNNVTNSRNLIEVAVDESVENFIFSSTAAVYGDPDEVPVSEEASLEPTNPYGRTKLVVEWMLEDTAEAFDDFNYVALRYFNVAGADPEGRTGQSGPNATHLVKVASRAALGELDELELYGTDYPTRDGTCIRDYIHVTDLASAHLAALAHLAESGESTALNCGYGHGFSVREVVETMKEVSGVDFDVRPTDRRPGDPAKLVSDSSKLREVFDWEPEHDDIEEIVGSALEWEEHLLV